MFSSGTQHLWLMLIGPVILGVPARAENWPQWRGPTGDSVCSAQGLPLQWSEGQNIIWKCSLPDGASTPAIWGEAVFVTGQKEDQLLLFKLNTTSGKIEWQRLVGTGTPKRAAQRGEQKFHKLQNLASPSPVTDGHVVVAHFGTGDLAAYDFAGKQLWHRNLQQDHGRYSIWWGHANSPVIYKDLVISVSMQDSLEDLGRGPVESYLVAHDLKTGQLRWKTVRKTAAKAEQCDSYTTPLFHEANGRVEMILMGGNQLDAYDPSTGKQLWFLPGLVGGRTITGPTIAQGLAFATRGMRGEMVAVKLGGTGELQDSAIVWKHQEGTSDTPCPVVWKDLIFWISDNGFAHCADARTGEVKWKQRLAGDFKASPLAAEGRIYFVNLSGRCTVVAAAAKFEKLAENQLDDEILASPAAVDGKLFLRGRQALYCLGKP